MSRNYFLYFVIEAVVVDKWAWIGLHIERMWVQIAPLAGLVSLAKNWAGLSCNYPLGFSSRLNIARVLRVTKTFASISLVAALVTSCFDT